MRSACSAAVLPVEKRGRLCALAVELVEAFVTFSPLVDMFFAGGTMLLPMSITIFDAPFPVPGLEAE